MESLCAWTDVASEAVESESVLMLRTSEVIVSTPKEYLTLYIAVAFFAAFTAFSADTVEMEEFL